MKNTRGFVLGLVLGLGLALSGVGFAQSITQTDNKKADASCCAMSCCSGDSCATMKHDDKDHSKMGGCCGGDSCSMMQHAKNHASKDSCCCGSDSCATHLQEMKEKPKN